MDDTLIAVSLPFRSLAASLVRRAIRVAIACTLFVSGLQSVVTIVEERKSAERELQRIAATNVPLLAAGLRETGPESIRLQLARLASDPAIAYVRLEEHDGRLFEAGRAEARDPAAARTFALPLPPGGKGALGTMEITPDRGALLRGLVEKVLVIVLGYGLLAAAMCGLVHAVLKAELEQPLRLLARFTSELTPEHLTVPLAPLHGPREWQDEIDLVANGFRTLQDGIHAHVATLDARVAIRTAQLEAALEENRALTLIDPLTGCFNRRYLDARLGEEVLRSRRSRHALSIVLVDIDHFKRINDTLGHAAGDHALRVLAGVFRRALRERIDWMARLGGEEFVVVLPDASLEDAARIAERMRATVESTRLEHAGRMIHVTSSFGVAQYDDSDDAASMLARADALLYQAKTAGRNRVARQAEVFS